MAATAALTDADLAIAYLGRRGSVIYLGYFATIGGDRLWGKLLARLPAATVSPMALLVPVVGISSGSILLGEELSSWQVGGSLLVMVGLVIHMLGS